MTHQPEMFGGEFCVPKKIDVGPFGIAESWLEKTLNLTPSALHAFHGEQLGAPRDYRYRSTGFFYTAEGVRRVLALHGHDGRCQVIEHKAPPMPAKPRVHPHAHTGGRRHGLV